MPLTSLAGWDAHAWVRSVLLGIALAAIYLANGREIGSYDTIPTALTALNLIQGEGIHLDRFAPLLRESDGRTSPYVERTQGHIVSRYPLAPAFLAAPLMWPHLVVFDRRYPGWSDRIDASWAVAQQASKTAAAILAALAGVSIYRLLHGLGLAAVALPATIGAALGSNLWMIGSQALWQHAPAALMLSVTLLLLLPERPTKLRLLLAGGAMGLMIACRSIDVVFLVPIVAWLAVNRPRSLPWLAPWLLAIGGATVGVNLHYFGEVTGGLAALEAMHPELHGVEGTWSGDLLGGALGTLFSPARGVFVYTPWALLAVLLAPWSLARLRGVPMIRWAVVGGLTLNLLVLSKYAVWWAGHTFGPRYWTDAVPLLAILLAAGMDWARGRAWGLNVLFALLIALAIGIQVLGATCYPSSWNLSPTNVDRDHDRLWDWTDTELRRGIAEALAAPARRG